LITDWHFIIGIPPEPFSNADNSDATAVIDANTSPFVAVYGLGTGVDTDNKALRAAD
jgi:hypothetical protein